MCIVNLCVCIYTYWLPVPDVLHRQGHSRTVWGSKVLEFQTWLVNKRPLHQTAKSLIRELEGYTGVNEYINEHRLPISKWSNGFSTSYVSLQAGNATQMLQVSSFMTSPLFCYCQTSESRRSPFHVGLNENKTWCAMIYRYTHIYFSAGFMVFFGWSHLTHICQVSLYTTNQLLSTVLLLAHLFRRGALRGCGSPDDFTLFLFRCVSRWFEGLVVWKRVKFCEGPPYHWEIDSNFGFTYFHWEIFQTLLGFRAHQFDPRMAMCYREVGSRWPGPSAVRPRDSWGQRNAAKPSMDRFGCQKVDFQMVVSMDGLQWKIHENPETTKYGYKWFTVWKAGVCRARRSPWLVSPIFDPET